MRREIFYSWKVRSGLIIIAFSILLAALGPTVASWMGIHPRRI